MSEARKAAADEQNGFNPIRLWLKALGTLADSATMQGKAVKSFEERMSSSFSKLSGSDTFLTQVGRAMERSFILRAQANRNMEKALASMRLPSTADMDDIRTLLLVLTDKVEAVGFQLDEAVDRLEAMEKHIQALEEGPKAAPRRRRSTKSTAKATTKASTKASGSKR